MSIPVQTRSASVKGMSDVEKRLIEKLDPNTKALWTLINGRLRCFDDSFEKQNKRIKSLESKVEKVVKIIDSNEINIFREVN